MEESFLVLTYFRYPSHRLEGLKETAEYIIDDSRTVRPGFI
jgi:hypothetical protein